VEQTRSAGYFVEIMPYPVSVARAPKLVWLFMLLWW